jgi:pimeloyl-ACP methyl ester carboxylesterase
MIDSSRYRCITMAKRIPKSNPATTKVSGIEITYDTFGDPQDEPLLLIVGLGQQLVSWDKDFCAKIAGNGYWVIRFDNRDSGLSTKCDEAGVPDKPALFRALSGTIAIEAPYSLLDMADDALGLLDALGVSSAHVVGESMGGMIAQRMAIHRTVRVRTLVSIMSSTGDPGLPHPTPEATNILIKRPPTDREGYIEDYVARWRVLHGPNFPYDEEGSRQLAMKIFDRGLNTPGFVRQLAAILADCSRKEDLKSVTIPTLVIHGDTDPLVPVECGIDTAHSVPGAKLLIIEGMGHFLPRQVWKRVIDAIATHAI